MFLFSAAHLDVECPGGGHGSDPGGAEVEVELVASAGGVHVH